MKTKAKKVISSLILGIVLLLMVIAQGNWAKAMKEASKYPLNKQAQEIVFQMYGFEGTEEPGLIRKVVALFKN